jgi:CHAD domain-containing protein
MSFKIAASENFSEGLKSRVKEQCSQSEELIQAKEKSNPHEVIHEVRKAFKKIRGALRLVRDHIDFYKEENVFFRDEGRRISEIRDATSVIEALDDLYERHANQFYKKTFKTFRNFLLSRQSEMASEYVDKKGVLKSIKKRLSKKHEEIDKWSINIQSFEDIAPSIKRVYKRGRKAYNKAKESKSNEDFHEWRKRVKYLRYQLRLLNRIWPGFLECWEDELHDLSDFLGDDRDLLMLNRVVEAHRDQFADKESYELLKSLIAFRRSNLEANALQLGKRLYGLKKKSFLKLLQASWEAYDGKN